MITKEFFVKKMNELEEIYNKQTNFINSLVTFASDNFISEYFEADCLSWTLNFIELNILGKLEDWMAFFVLDCGCDFSKAVVFRGDEQVEINNWNDVYDFLISIKELS